VLEATERKGEYVVLTQWGKPFSVKALGMRMQGWTRAAGLAPGHTMHGLRKTLGKLLAENCATTREIMAVLGHDCIQHAELYTREAEQRRLAAEGMKKLTAIQGGKHRG
jgi:integrase